MAQGQGMADPFWKQHFFSIFSKGAFCGHDQVFPSGTGCVNGLGALGIVLTKSNGIWHQTWSQASLMKPTPSCEERWIARGPYKPLLQYLSRQVIGVLPLAAPDNHRTGCSWTEWEASLISMNLTYSCQPFRYKANGWGLICNHEVGL